MAQHPVPQLRDKRVVSMVDQILWDALTEARGDVPESTFVYRILQQWHKDFFAEIARAEAPRVDP